ncbi:MAG: gamma carbonic anhydrase family protein [Thermoplasmata archaeon HGW-Thermoplasmata-1]|nr:MAG: gamma carbonic anhydrase family protein [Thermoplasmata archaeon HGW-Thermoplasmata-1]
MVMEIHESVFIADTAVVIGDVEIGKDASVWYGVVIRGDTGKIIIREGANIQDNCVVHAEPGGVTEIGKNVTIGHGAVIHGPKIEENALIGMNAVVLDRVVVGRGSLVGANALVTAGTEIPPHSLVLGAPAKVVKTNPAFEDGIKQNAEIYKELARKHKGGRLERYMP